MANELNNQPIAGAVPGAVPEEQANLAQTSPMGPAPIPGAESVVPPGVTPQPGEETPISEEAMRQDLERKLSDVENQNNALETKKFISRNKLKNFKVEMVRDIFAMVQKLGVDPADPESIKNFLLSLEQQDPDLLLLFQTIFETLSPDGPSAIDDLSGDAPMELEQEQPVAPDMGAPIAPGMEAPISPEAELPAGPSVVPGIEPPVESGGPNLMDKYSSLQEQILR